MKLKPREGEEIPEKHKKLRLSVYVENAIFSP
jgi:hypothetical protein